MPAMSFCDSEFSAVVTHPASTQTAPSAAIRANLRTVPNAPPGVPLYFTQPSRKIK
jgi:hypothetical protein